MKFGKCHSVYYGIDISEKNKSIYLLSRKTPKMFLQSCLKFQLFFSPEGPNLVDIYILRLKERLTLQMLPLITFSDSSLYIKKVEFLAEF